MGLGLQDQRSTARLTNSPRTTVYPKRFVFLQKHFEEDFRKANS
jgi:hypothetical protein